ncbi:MAG: hypothetical protein MJY88_05960 [Bacteroidales bacterium]|nr:hypothetical protein [Bacteroidales bacterium]
MKKIATLLLAAAAVFCAFSCSTDKKFTLVVPECEITTPPDSLNLDSFYKKYVNANGIHIISSERVADSVLRQAFKTIYTMTSALPAEVVGAMAKVNTKVAIMARYEGTEDIPEHSYMANRDTSDIVLNWNLRARGLGGSVRFPMTSGAEENVMGYQIDKYHAEDILLHEFSHSIHLVGICQVDPSINDKLEALLAKAREEHRFDNTYAQTDIAEYWAEGVQDWFNVNAEMPYSDGKHNWVNTREELKAYDPGLYELIAQYFPPIEEQIGRHPYVNLYGPDSKPEPESAEEQAFKTPEYTITAPPKELKLPKFYSKHVNVNGIPIVSSWRVPDSCFVQAEKIIYAMTNMLPERVLKAMVDKGTRVAIMARYEGTTDIPEHAYMLDHSETGVNMDVRARGLEGTLELPLTTCAEENILGYQIDQYHAEDILIHEFAHSIQLIGIESVDPEFHDKLQGLLDKAMAEGKYKNVYANTNATEYWAEGVQDWFNCNAEMPKADGKHFWVNTREDLKAYDPGLYELISQYFPAFEGQLSKHKKVNLYTSEN